MRVLLLLLQQAFAFFSQILKSTQQSLNKIGSGKVVSLASKDLKPIHTFVKRFPYVFIAPLQVFVLTIPLWQLVGAAALTGILYLVFIGIYLWVTFKPLKRLRKETSRFTAVRLTQIENTINAVRLVKISTWENHFQDSIGKVRRYKCSLLIRFNKYSDRRCPRVVFGRMSSYQA